MLHCLRVGLGAAVLGAWLPTATPVVAAASSKTVAGPLRMHPTNPRYFTDDGRRAIYLTGSRTNNTFV